MSKHTATCYLQVAADTWRTGSEPRIRGLDIVAMTKNPPAKPKPGTVTIKVHLTLPDAVFLPLTPTVTVEIPAEGVEVAPLVDATPMPVPVLVEEEDDTDG